MGAHHGEEIPFIFGTRTFWNEGSDEEKTSEECMKRWSSLATDFAGEGEGEAWGEYEVGKEQRLVIGPKGGETRMETIQLSELERARQDFWSEAIANKECATAL